MIESGIWSGFMKGWRQQIFEDYQAVFICYAPQGRRARRSARDKDFEPGSLKTDIRDLKAREQIARKASFNIEAFCLGRLRNRNRIFLASTCDGSMASQWHDAYEAAKAGS
jgi:hypothetical protein